MAGEELWQECCHWLARIELITRDHVLTSENAKLADLCRFLRDGVMICKILHILDEGCIDLRAINQRPQNAQFLCMKNISIFLSTCEKFGLHKDDLFEPQMLFELTDFGKVLSTLSKLSKTPKAQQLQVEGFPLVNGRYDEAIYDTLVKDIENHNVEAPNTPTVSAGNGLRFGTNHNALGLPSRRRHNSDEAVYESLCYVTLKPKEELARDLPREKRDLCLQELIETENNYVEALEMLTNKFLRPLRELIEESQIVKIFSKIPELAKIHRILHQGLKKAQNNPHAYSVSQVFLDNQEKLLVYGEYCANLTSAQQELEDTMKNNDAARQKIQECQKEVSKGRHQLREYLVVPLQRILKYHLLLRELIRYTSANHPDLDNLKKAHEAMMDLADYINEVKRDNEMLQIIEDIQTSIMDIPEELRRREDLGKLRLDGEIKIECHPEPNKKRYVFVFDKVMMMCKSAKRLSQLFVNNNSNRWSMGETSGEEEKYVFKDCVKLENCKVEDTVLTSSGGTIRNKQNSFFLVVSGNKKAYTIITKDLDSKEKWMKSITDAIESLSPPENQSQNHSFAITTFKMPNTRCSICKKLMKGSIFQGYQCPTCKMIVHKSCLNKLTQNHTCTIEYPGNQFSVSLAVPHNAPQPPIPDNLQVQEYPWWAERMSRNEATIHLGLAAEGTFLLRWSDHNEQPVLSLKAMGEVKHMRVYRQEETGYFYLSEARYFTSVVDLVHHYRSSPLSESFTGLDCCLRRPIYDTAIVRYPYEGSGAGHLRLVQGQRVMIISREGEGRGWWKGRIGSRMGYFPREYVTLETDPLAGW
ncbi:protein vav-like isoform X2 [Penaeus chinensis]|uniref:protein vav-like isoform X2 n=1 Tax=Penaeus chinensis TaxID=139456 RepID=UPI001FB7B370|nr:protein vav-like isoform X2 [Penaeus chinensis]